LEGFFFLRVILASDQKTFLIFFFHSGKIGVGKGGKRNPGTHQKDDSMDAPERDRDRDRDRDGHLDRNQVEDNEDPSRRSGADDESVHSVYLTTMCGAYEVNLGPAGRVGKGREGEVFLARAVGEVGWEYVAKVCAAASHLATHEVKALATVFPHDNVVKLVANTLLGPHACFIFPRWPTDLLEVVSFRHGLTEPEAQVVFKELAAGTLQCHRAFVAHLDIKPENVLVRMEAGKVVGVALADFGGAAWMSQSWGVSRLLRGTRYFQAPEQAVLNGQWRQKAVWPQCDCERCTLGSGRPPKLNGVALDVWALGATLFSMLSNQCLTIGETCEPLDVFLQPTTVPASVTWSSQVRDLLKSMLCLCPYRRPTVQQVLEHPWCVVPAEEVLVLSLGDELVP
jgi:hypothetical protein